MTEVSLIISNYIHLIDNYNRRTGNQLQNWQFFELLFSFFRKSSFEGFQLSFSLL